MTTEVMMHTTIYVEVPENKQVDDFIKELDNMTLPEIMDKYSVERGDSNWQENM